MCIYKIPRGFLLSDEKTQYLQKFIHAKNTKRDLQGKPSCGYKRKNYMNKESNLKYLNGYDKGYENKRLCELPKYKDICD